MTLKFNEDGTVTRRANRNDVWLAERTLRENGITAERRDDGKYLVEFGVNVEVMAARDVYMLARGLRLGLKKGEKVT